MCGKNIDMTRGPIKSQLIAYAIPILLGELFQQLYNTVDAIILGNFVGDGAMAAVGATDSMIKMLVGFFNGVSTGCTVVVARSFGKKDAVLLRQSVHTIIYLSFGVGVILSILGIAFTGPLLRILATPANILPLAARYVRIYFTGLLGLVIYNTGTGILRAVGDTRRPFFFLLFSSLLNLSLDLFFVLVFSWGVSGVAYATVLSQTVAAGLCLALLHRSRDVYRFRFLDGGIRGEIILEVLWIGIPTGIQKTLTSFSNVIVLSHINFFGEACLAGWVVYTKISHFLVVGLQSIGSSVTTFVSQNIGARQHERAVVGVRTAVLLSFGFTAFISTAVRFFALPLAQLFGDDSGMLKYAELFLTNLILFQVVHVPASLYSAALRGMGRANSATIFMLLGLIGARQLYLTIMTAVYNTPLSVGFSFPVGWMAAGIMLYSFYRRTLRTMEVSNDLRKF